MLRGMLGLGFLLSSLAFAQEIQLSNCQHTNESFNCVEFLKNYDGDTFTVNIESVHPLIGKKITVRVAGIDAPEMETRSTCERRAALRAQQEVQRLLQAAHRIDLANLKRDKYFRVLATVMVDGVSLADKLLRMKLVVPYDGGHKQDTDWCNRDLN